MARSGYCTLTPEEGLWLEDYARAHGVEGRRWQRPFTAGRNAAKAEALREKLLAPIEALRGELKKAGNAGGSVEAVVHFLEAEKDEVRMQQLFCRIWVRKESYIKAKGKGLALPLNAFSVLPLAGGPLRFYEPEMPEGYRAACLLLTEEEAAFTCSRTDLTAGF